MSSATGLCGVVDEGAGGAAELVVEHHGGSEGGESGAEACAEVREGSGAVSLECEDVLAGPEDRFDPLADRREVRVVGFAGRAGVWGDQRRRPRYRGAQRRPGRGGVAAFLGVSVFTLQSWRSRVTGGGPPVTKVGGMVMYSMKELEEYMEQRTVERR